MIIITRKLHVITRKLHVFILIALLLPACSLHRTARRASSAQLMEYSQQARQDSLRWEARLRMSMEQTLCLQEFVLSPPDSTGGQYVERVRLLTSEAKATGSATEERRQSTSITAEGITTAQATTAKDSRKETRPWGLPGGWWWMAGIVGIGIAAIRFFVKT